MTLEEKVECLKQIVLNNDTSINKLALAYDFDPNQIENIYQIFEKYSKMCYDGDTFDYSDVEKDFGAIGIDYQSLKSVILAFGDAGKFLDVIAQYLKSNNEKMSGLPCEYHRLYDKLFPKK